MATKNLLNGKRLQIDKANSTMIIAISVCSFIVVFSVFASKALLNQRTYQTKVIAKQEKARDTLNSNIEAAKKLQTTYQAFVQQSPNLLDGDPNGKGTKDGDNGKITLDALPSQYDFPALMTSIKALAAQGNVRLSALSGTDEELTRNATGQSTSGQSSSSSSSVQATPIEIPFSIGVAGSYVDIQNMINVLEKSIRPISIGNISFSGTDKDLSITVRAKTYYQPAKELTIKDEVMQ